MQKSPTHILGEICYQPKSLKPHWIQEKKKFSTWSYITEILQIRTAYSENHFWKHNFFRMSVFKQIYASEEKGLANSPITYISNIIRSHNKDTFLGQVCGSIGWAPEFDSNHELGVLEFSPWTGSTISRVSASPSPSPSSCLAPLRPTLVSLWNK